MKKIYNIVSYYNNQVNVVATFEIEGENEDDCDEQVGERLEEFIENLAIEEE